MKKLLLATHNKGKVSELSEMLAPLGIKVVSAAEFNIPEPEETGTTFHENARLKAVHSAQIANLPALADDSGLCIPALGGAPGIYSARWGGPEKDFVKACEKIREELEKMSGSTSPQPSPHRRGSENNLPPMRGDVRGVQYRPYNPENSDKAKELRKNSTQAEKILWNKIRMEQLGHKFRRQEPIGNYIADFICLNKKLIIEIDGGQHDTQQQYDDLRTQYFNDMGYRVIRFWNNQVTENLDGVLQKIIKELDAPPPSPPHRRGEKENLPPHRRGEKGKSTNCVNGTPAYFICVLSLAQADGSSIEFEGRVDGKLTFPARGAEGFGYDPIFVPDHDTRTFGEMSQLEKNRKNHRADAFAKFKEFLADKSGRDNKQSA